MAPGMKASTQTTKNMERAGLIGRMAATTREFILNEIEGKGKYHWSDGREYEGDWVQNKMHGQGTFIYPDGKKYIGEYKKDKKDGFG